MLLVVLLLHLVVGLGLIVVGDRLGARSFLVAAIAPLGTLVALTARAREITRGGVIESTFDWIPQLELTIDLRLDAMGLVLALIVSGVGVLVCVYAVGYFSHPKPGIGRLAGLMTLFAGAMIGIAASDHLLALFVFWELTSVTSYLLIGNDDENSAARAAALSAILITGLGGLVMLAGFVVIGQDAGTYRLSELLLAPPTGTAATVGVVLVLVGAFTKSAQFPFGGWLPGAMVAPTPISTYLHAATMVKAGVFLVARLAPILAGVTIWRPVVLTVVVDHDDRGRVASPPPARPQAAPGVRNGQPARIPDAPVRDGRLPGGAGGDRGPDRARGLQGRAVHDRRHRRSPDRHPRRPRARPAGAWVVAGDGDRGRWRRRRWRACRH